MNDKRMGEMKLGNFSGITRQLKPTPGVAVEVGVKPTVAKPVKSDKSKAKVSKKAQKKEQVVTVNIKIRKSQKEWLTDTASQVRENNTEPVPPSQRVYPQHLIGVAIDFLEAAGVNWDEVKNIEELREKLNL